MDLSLAGSFLQRLHEQGWIKLKVGTRNSTGTPMWMAAAQMLEPSPSVSQSMATVSEAEYLGLAQVLLYGMWAS